MTPAKTLAKALTRFIGPNAVLAHQDGAKLQGQYVLVQVPQNRQLGGTEQRYSNDKVGGRDVVESIQAMREVMYSVQVVRDGAQEAADRAEALRLGLLASAARQHMLGYGLAYSRTSDVRDLTNPSDAAQEPRFQFDVFYTTVQTIESVVYAIEGIDIIGDYRSAFHEHKATIQVRKP